MNMLKRLTFLLAIFSTCVLNVYAECDISVRNKLGNDAIRITVDYELVEDIVENTENFNPPEGLSPEEIEEYVYTKEVFQININNITEDMYVVVKDTLSGNTKKYEYKDTDNGRLSIKQDKDIEINKYTISVYPTASTGCSTTSTLTTKNITLPMFNKFSMYAICNGVREYYLCHEYLDVKINEDEGSFTKKVEAYRIRKEKEKQKENEKKKKGILEFLKEHGTTITIITLIVVAGGVVTTVVIIKRRRRII